MFRRARSFSLRSRLLLVSVAALAAGLALGGVLMIGVLDVSLLRAVNAETLDTAQGIAKLIDQGSLGQVIPAAPNLQAQVVEGDGTVVAYSANTDPITSMLYEPELKRVTSGTVVQVPGARLGVDGTADVVVVTAGAPTKPVYVLVGRSTEDLGQALRILRAILLVVFPLLVVVLGVVLWRVLGAALRPVDALRTGAEEITGGTRAGSLPVPDSRDEIHRLAVTLNDMLGRLDAARARQRGFVADAAHELRSPLTNMRTELEVAQRLHDTTDWPVLAGDLLTDVERLSRLVDDLLLLARADDGMARPGAAPLRETELGGLLADLASRYPDVEYLRPAVPLVLRAEPDALGRAVANLLDNAVRHARSTVLITAGTDGGHHVITVADDGPGIPAADRERVFDRFTRLDDGRARDAGGTGLGLAIVREMVRKHGGTVTLGDNDPGLLVTVRLPISR